jgi:hypothetical protein
MSEFKRSPRRVRVLWGASNSWLVYAEDDDGNGVVIQRPIGQVTERGNRYFAAVRALPWFGEPHFMPLGAGFGSLHLAITAIVGAS